MRRDPLAVRKATLVDVLARALPGLRFNEHLDEEAGEMVFQHACKLGLEGIALNSALIGAIFPPSGDSLTGTKNVSPVCPRKVTIGSRCLHLVMENIGNTGLSRAAKARPVNERR
jgi:hypothetical protein